MVMGYEDIQPHLLMLSDLIRCETYEAAIRKTVQPGHTVLDFGCGTGLLSFFAARAGAKRVYAMDNTTIVRTAKTLAEKNGFENIDFFYNSEGSITLPSKVDVLVSEWMGCFVFHEWMLEPLIQLREAYLEDGGVMVPRRVDLRVGFVSDEGLVDELTFFDRRPFNLDFSPIADWPSYNILLKRISHEQILPDLAHVGSLDMQTITGTPEMLVGSVESTTEDTIYGICGWFDAVLCDGVALSTSPFTPKTHWNQMVFPLARPVRVKPGEKMTVSFSPSRREIDKTILWKWSLETETDQIHMDNFIHRAFATRPLVEGKL